MTAGARAERGCGRGVSIIVPTLREAQNIPALAARIDAALSGGGTAWELLLVDDDSDDGSDRVVAQLAERLPVRMEVRKQSPRDLSAAVLLGFQLARYDRLVVLDADLSHPPERIADLLAALGDGREIVMGSRYGEGGSVGPRWGVWRLLNSRLATALARPLASCSDPLSGFFAIPRRALPDLAGLDPLGYKIGLELLVRGQLEVKEVPIEFAKRQAGSSKMGWRQQVDFLRHLGRLYRYRFGGLTRAACFGLVGASGLVIDVSIYLGLQSLGVEHRTARLVSFWPAVSWNWLVNRRVTYNGRPTQPRLRQWAKFTASSLIGLGANVGTYAALTTWVAGFDRRRLLALLTGVAVGGMLNFLVATMYVYRRHAVPGPPRGRRVATQGTVREHR
ncbi:MAG: glycosyltransferase [Bryobacterales bacterium]|nr:glycosyltransferase [Bryobacterales bacterium]